MKRKKCVDDEWSSGGLSKTAETWTEAVFEGWQLTEAGFNAAHYEWYCTRQEY